MSNIIKKGTYRIMPPKLLTRKDREYFTIKIQDETCIRYSGNIILNEDGTIFGKGFDQIYYDEVEITGSLREDVMGLKVTNYSREDIIMIFEKTNNLPEYSLDYAEYYLGESTESKGIDIYIELINFKDIKSKLDNDSLKLVKK